MLAQKNRTGVADTFEPALGHGKHPNFIDGTKAVFDGANQTKLAVRIAFKVQDGVHHVLQHTRSGQRTFLRHVAYQHDADAAGLGRTGQVGRTLAHLRYRARRGGELVGINGLDGVNDRNVGPKLCERCENFF